MHSGIFPPLHQCGSRVWRNLLLTTRRSAVVQLSTSSSEPQIFPRSDNEGCGHESLASLAPRLSRPTTHSISFQKVGWKGFFVFFRGFNSGLETDGLEGVAIRCIGSRLPTWRTWLHGPSVRCSVGGWCGFCRRRLAGYELSAGRRCGGTVYAETSRIEFDQAATCPVAPVHLQRS